MQNLSLPLQITRPVNDCGETLIVREIQGIKVLADPVDTDVIVIVPIGRRAELVRFSCDDVQLQGIRRCNLSVVTTRFGLHYGFAVVGNLHVCILLEELSVGQTVDVHPYIAVVAARLAVPLHVLHASVAVPVYALAA